MYNDNTRALLQKPLLARLSTIDENGYPHTVPVWFDLDGDDVVVIAVRGTRKVGHVLRNPKGAVAVGGDSGDGGGVLIKGELSLEEDPDDAWVTRLCYRYESPEQAARDVADWADLDIILLRLKPRSVHGV